MVHPPQTLSKSSDGNAHSPEAQHLLSQLHEMGVNVVPGAPDDAPNSSGHVSATATSDPEGTQRGAYHQGNILSGNGWDQRGYLSGSCVKCSVHKKYMSFEAALGTFQGAVGLDTVKLLSKD
ncbi:hypothetical protein L208DRAFT_1377072 [Tricholoma matsutake]|nr:hypothetical protein L208DRAFT_1377072 [Tricholoma matsutake 945]